MLEETYQYTVVCTAKSSMFTISEAAFSERFRTLPDVKKKMIANFKERVSIPHEYLWHCYPWYQE